MGDGWNMNKRRSQFNTALSRGAFVTIVFLASGSALLALQSRSFQRYRPDGASSYTDQKDEFAFARLRYPIRMASYGGFGDFGMFRNGGWSEDYPRADRQFVQGVLRLTRIDARPYQEAIDPDSDEIFNWPWLYAVNVANWDFNDE